jgi:hypothetical protein
VSATALEGSVAQVLAEVPVGLRLTVDALLVEMEQLHPQATVLAWPRQRIISFGFGPRKMSEHYAYIGVQSKHVNLGFYYGTSLPDPRVLLEGSGKRLRHVKVESTACARSPEVRVLLKEAIREIKARIKTAA